MSAGKIRRKHDEQLEEIARRLLRKVGIDNGKTVLDFGCGSGSYTIPAARIVGGEGKVIALDKDAVVLDELMRKAESEGLENIKKMRTSGELKIDLREKSIDMVLLYDVFHDYYFLQTSERRKLLGKFYRILKPNGILSVYPKHMDSGKIKAEIESANFVLEHEYSGALIHDNKDIEGGRVLNFRKRTR